MDKRVRETSVFCLSNSEPTPGKWRLRLFIPAWFSILFLFTLVFVGCSNGSPKTPSNLALAGQGNLTIQAIAVAWRDESNNEEAFIVERATSSEGPWHPVIVVEAQDSTTTYPVQFDKTVAPGKRYWYRVYACNERNHSKYSVVESVEAPGTLGSKPIPSFIPISTPC